MIPTIISLHLGLDTSDRYLATSFGLIAILLLQLRVFAEALCLRGGLEGYIELPADTLL